ncbi:MAG: phospholipid carrier-dependent glycosyltransferase [Candidatus Aminicenantes bacterium]|nr:phospholipid carrier-dependent glycosyltransferase [Candidatus Aminicenantes bacterium]NIM81132.1 phospholipid carrier-dependent glycosyltransferase [Candidatus Aminicenantes bacterium]NIN20506.1 phospholipid carrier-dependent glycosyltransferase [Candidatus Aminicenantes bacterium]NIN44279.1 phospholipid carrier-dependent glycosyltransferase [Candidatus Aminicenantes bacterium]NIN87098.1 phospholipid carrier-dependent glycosyltransferase [Candidatus Aminicenantes bacterium]
MAKKKKKAKKRKTENIQKPLRPKTQEEQEPQEPPKPQVSRFREILERITSSKLTPIILCLLFLINGLYVSLQNSGTCDELGAHITSGYLYWDTGKFSGGINNPPLGQLIISSLVKLFGLEYTLFSEQHLFLFRLPVLIIGLLLAIFIYRFAVLLYDKKIAIIALFFYCFSPNILAHTSLASLDVPIAFFIFLAFYFCFSFIKNPRLLSFIGLCVSLSFALSTKVQAVLLVPLLIIIFAAYYKELKQNEKINIKTVTLYLLLFILIPLIIINVVYLSFPFAKGNSILPGDYIGSISQKFQHSEKGHFAYLLGNYSKEGWWYYFPLVILFKTPLAVLLFLFPGVLRKPDKKTLLFILLPILVFLAAAMRSHVNIGIRHILIIYPFIFLLAALGVERIININQPSGRRRQLYIGIAGLLMFSYLVQAIFITPHQLSYFNLLAGGSKNGHKILIDSNYDWGQNDYYLYNYIKEKGIDYKINPYAVEPTSGYILVNVNALYGVLNKGAEAYKWLKQYKPINQIAYTWFEYYIPESDLWKLEKFSSKEKLADPEINRARLEYLQERHANDTNPKPHLQLAVMFIDNGDYRNAFKEIRYVLKHDSTNKFALSLGGELIVRFKLGALIFRDDDYIEFFKSNI